jgi:DNA-binding transcriptional LysR family regulator
MVVFSRFSRYFEEVAKRGSIRGAGDRANVASSAINRQILQAEEDLGVPLFERHASGMRLTAAGEVLVYHLRRWQQEYEHVKDEIDGRQGLHGGRISVAVAESLVGGFLSQVITEFNRLYPRILLTVKVPPESAVDLLLSGEADVCLTYRPITHRALRVQYSLKQPLGVIMHPDHPLASRKRLRLSDCIDHPVIMLDKDIMTQNRVMAALDQFGLELRPAMVVDSFDFLRLLVQQGAGIGFLKAADCIAEREEGRLVFVELEEHVRPLDLSLVTTPHPTPTVIRFSQYIADRFAEVAGPPSD